VYYKRKGIYIFITKVLLYIDDGLSTLFLLDDGTSIIPIFEATQAAQVVPDDVTEPAATIAQQAQLNRANARKSLQAQANRKMQR
jgi:hypothetical protein